MADANPTPRFVRALPDGRFAIEIDKYIDRPDGKSKQRTRIRRVLPAGTSLHEAQSIASKLAREMTVRAAAVAVADGWDDYVARMSEQPKSWLYATIQNVRYRSRKKGMECTLTVAQLRQILTRCRGRCEVTGLRFTLEESKGLRTRPYFYSIDRIDSSRGYTIDNVRMVCVAANYAMNAWGEEVFAEIARGFVFNRYSALYGGVDLESRHPSGK